MIHQTQFHLSAKRRGCHLITREVMEHLSKPLPQTGLLNLFVQHTSCALSINENADPDVRTDLDQIMNHLVKENESYYEHTMEGPDDMPAHAKCSLFGVSLTIPIT
ncbi:MAG: secondary thiamine-phosphate synthase enzyme YjbQ, partial [Bacteroidaceae bacterium]|nr:secondary thiamine-phosphate synthase enzyme YjbQ [Bacteroidaceae bacterium]